MSTYVTVRGKEHLSAPTALEAEREGGDLYISENIIPSRERVFHPLKIKGEKCPFLTVTDASSKLSANYLRNKQTRS